MTNNLLTIEENFLSNSEVKNALKLNDIKRLQTNLSNGQKRKFDYTIELSKVVKEATDYFISKEGKQKFAAEGISWSMEEFAQKVFGWKNSYFCKVRKAANLDNTIVENFKSECENIEREGKDSNRTLEGLLKYAKQVESGESGESGESEENAALRVETIFTLAYKRESGNIAVKVDINNVVKTTNTKAEILEAINFLTNLLPNE